jgi:hypothetical protein
MNDAARSSLSMTVLARSQGLHSRKQMFWPSRYRRFRASSRLEALRSDWFRKRWFLVHSTRRKTEKSQLLFNSGR